MTQSIEFSESRLTKGVGSPISWLRIVWSIWFDAPWYQSNIHPKLKNAAEAKWLLLQTVLGALLISTAGLVGTWLVGQCVERIVPVYSGYMDFNTIAIMLCPILFGGAGAIGSQVRNKTLAGGIPLAAGAAVLGLAYFASMSAALIVLLVVPFDPQVSSSPFLAQWKINLILIFPLIMILPSVQGLAAIDQSLTQSGPREAKFFGIFRQRGLRLIFGIGWVTAWALHGATVILSDWRYYPRPFGDLLFILELIGFCLAFLYAISVFAHHRQARAQLDA